MSILTMLAGRLFGWQPKRPLNQEELKRVIIIHPYRKSGGWVFDDARVGLRAEALICGVPELIQAVKEFKEIRGPISIQFSASRFIGHDLELFWSRHDGGGNWYFSPRFEIECWLCPALFRYYPSAPRKLYASVVPRITPS